MKTETTNNRLQGCIICQLLGKQKWTTENKEPLQAPRLVYMSIEVSRVSGNHKSIFFASQLYKQNKIVYSKSVDLDLLSEALP
jgi:hypothetical protein